MMLGKKRSKKTILFLCTGDTCRGPMAQGYMKEALLQKEMKGFDIRTAGVMTIAGLIPTQEAVQVMKNAGVDITGHRSTPLTPELVRKADLILGMSPFHVQFALRLSEDARGKTYLLKEFAQSDMKNYQITDPMGATLEVYKRVYREMKMAIDRMIEQKEFFIGTPEEKRPAVAPVAAKKGAAPPAKPVKGKPEKEAPAAAPAKAAKAPAKAAPPAAKPAAKAPAAPAAKAPAKAPAKQPAARPTPPPPARKKAATG